MNDNIVFLTACTFIASGAGWYAGHYFERKKAKVAFGRVIRQSIESTTAMANASIGLILKREPDAKPDDLAKELMAECRKYGMEAVALSREQAIKAGLTDGNDQTK